MRKLERITEILKSAGAADVVMVGGCVRDELLGIRSKDIDIEVYGLSYRQMASALAGSFKVNQVGQSFNVLKIDNEFDLTIPRRESKNGAGHKGFDVEADPSMTFAEAASRRDLTINAIGMRADGAIVDPFHGVEDLKAGILRAPTEAFCEDPLRVLRAMQFAARFGFDIEPRTVELCRRVLPEFKTLSAERVYMEWYKWAAKGKYPSKGLELLCQTGWIDCFPELAALRGGRQYPSGQPEGDAFTKTCLVCDEAARLAAEERLPEQDRVILMFAALCRDFGKAESRFQEKPGVWRLPNHARDGIDVIERFLNNMKPPLWLLENVIPLCANHMFHTCAPDPSKPTDSLLRRLSARLEPSNIYIWSLLSAADLNGRTPKETPGSERQAFAETAEAAETTELGEKGRTKKTAESGEAGETTKTGETTESPNGPLTRAFDLSVFRVWLDRAKQLGIDRRKPKPLLQGRDLIVRGVPAGPSMGAILKRAWEAQLDGAFTDYDSATKWLDDNMN